MYEELTEEQKAQMEELREIVDRYPEEYDVEAFEAGRKGL